MKKVLCRFCICLLMVMLVGCKTDKPKTNQDTNAFDMKVATNIIDTYMRYSMKGDVENSKKLYSKQLQKNNKDLQGNELKIRGYQIVEVNEIGQAGVFKVRVARAHEIKPIASLDEYSIKVIKEEMEYKVDEINSNLEREAFFDKNEMRMRIKNNGKTNLIIETNGIPKYVFAKDDKTNLYKLQVPRKKLGVMGFDYEGSTVAFTTYDKDSYIAVIKIDESLGVQGKEEGGMQEGDKGGTAGDSTSGIAKEKTIGKEVISLDYLKDCIVEYITFSQGGKFVVVQYDKDKIGHCIRIYKPDNGNLIPMKFEESYPLDKVEIIFSSIDKDAIYYEVLSKGNLDKPTEALVGKWRLDLKDFSIKKL